MKKGIIKKSLKVAIPCLFGTLFLSGAVLTVLNKSNYDVAVNKKNDLISSYKLSQEYLIDLANEIKIVEESNALGAYKAEEYKNKKEYLLSDDFVEDSIMKNGDMEVKNNLQNINSKIKKSHTSTLVTAGVFTVTSVSGFVGGMVAIKKQFNKEYGLSSEDDVEYVID